MSLLGSIIMKGIATAATKSVIKTAGKAVVVATAQSQALKDDAVEKDGKLFVRTNSSSNTYIGRSAHEVVQELLGIGFENITLKSIKKLNARSIKKYGTIKSISINGNNEFIGIKRVLSTSHVVIEFLDFEKGVAPAVYNNVVRLNTGKIHCAEDLEVKKTQSIPPEKTASFCAYCGVRIVHKGARFCASCGKEIL